MFGGDAWRFLFRSKVGLDVADLGGPRNASGDLFAK
jgi:hypothetical protein